MTYSGRLLTRLLPLLLVVLWVATLGSFPGQDNAFAQEQAAYAPLAPRVVRIRATTDLARQRLVAAGVDLLEQRSGEWLLALVSEQQRRALLAEGWRLEIDAAQTAVLHSRAPRPALFRSGYQSVEEIEALLRAAADNHPQLAELVDYGDSWEKVQSAGARGHNLWAIRLSNKERSGPKPIFLLLAAIHPREIVTSELATRYVSYLLDAYGRDPEVTWLLDEHEVVVVPLANPDGRRLVEQGFLQRKNTNPSDGRCPTPPSINNQAGVDLNRNFSFAWGSVNDPDTPPCSETFPGQAAASEPETQALQSFVRGLFADRRGPGEFEAAPATTSGIMISLHAYSNLVLWPWGYTNDTAPNGAALARLGRKLATFNGYEARQSFDLYATSGTTEDWLYGERGVASFTFEVGPASGAECATFFPPFACLDGGDGGSFWPRNLPAFLYASRVARAPYKLSAGPDISDIQVVGDSQRITVTATVDAGASGGPIRSAALSIGRSVGRGGAAISLLPRDGVFDTAKEQVYAILPTDRVPDRTLLLLQGKSVEWGPIRAIWSDSRSDPPPVAKLVVWLPALRMR